MKKTFWDKRIPTLLGIALILVGVGITTYMVKQGALFSINANPSQQPTDVRISNVSDNSFTVSYVTSDSVIGSLNYGKSSSLGQTALDERDQQTVTSHKIHSINVRNLTQQTNYFFAIISGGQTYLNDNQLFEVTTAPSIQTSPPQQNPMSGKVILPDGSVPQEAIVYLTSDNSQVISTLVKSDGSYILPLNSIRSNSLSSYYQLSNSEELKMLISGDGLSSNISLSTSEISPVPTVTLSKDYDFRQTQQPSATSSASLQSFPTFNSSAVSQTPQILTPKQNQSFTDPQPLFNGTGSPNQKVEIIIHSNQQLQTNVNTDSNGNWSYRPSSPISPGNHTITIITKDANGVLKTISESFVVFASGTQVSQSATPSASITQTPSPTPIPMVTTGAQNPTPTVNYIGGVTSVPTPTPTLTTPVTVAPTHKQLPPTGNPSIMTAGIMGIVISLVGGLLLLLTRGGISAL